MTTKKTTTKATKKTETKTPKKATKKAGSMKTDPLMSLNQSMQALLEEIQDLGFLTSRDADQLAEDIPKGTSGTLTEGIQHAAKWEKKLAGHMNEFSSQGGDGKLSSVHESLLLWQRKLVAVPPTRAGMEQALAALKKVIPFAGATVFLRDPESQAVRPYFSSGFQVDLISKVAFDSGNGFSSWIATRKKPILYTSLHRNEAPQSDVVRSFMAVPLQVADVCVGVLTLGHSEDGAYKPSSLRTLMVVAPMLAGLVQRMMADAQVARLQVFDPVSGLMTSKHVESRLEEEVIRCRELGYSMTMVALELPELAAHADRFGPEYRTRALAEVGALVEGWIKAPEMVGLNGKDRILLILPGLGGGDRARNRISELTRALEGHSFPRRKRLTTRIAVAAYPSDAESSQDLLSYADRVLQDLHVVSRCGTPTASLEAA